MTLEETIKHAEYIVNNRKYAISVCWSVKDCEQIAQWLRELQERRKQPEIVHCGDCKHYKIDHPRANGYHCCYRCHNIFPMKEDDFCSCGRRAERRTDD